MIDPLQISVLMKALDFLFDEGHKILQERREHRHKKNDATTPPPLSADKNSIQGNDNRGQTDLIIKQKLMAKKVNPFIWKEKEDYIQHLLKLLEINTKKYYLAKEQYAKWGDVLVPAIIAHNLEEAEDGIRENIEKLTEVLGEVYEEEIDLKFLAK